MKSARARLAEFRLLAYRSCKHTRITLQDDVTALIGQNGSGKTNLLHGMLLLGTARRRRFMGNDETYTSKCRIEAHFIVKKKKVRLRAAITYRPTEAARDEVILSDERWNFKEIDGNNKWIKGEDIEFLIRRMPQGVHYVVPVGGSRIRVMHSRNVFLQNQRKTGLSKNAVLAMESIQRFRAAITYYSASQFTNPSLSPTSIDVDEDGDLRDDVISSRRPTHTRLIYDLYNLSKTNPKAYDAYLSLIDKRGVHLIDKINWRDVKFSSPAYEVRSGGKVISQRRTRIMIIPTVHVGSSQLSFNQLSEGSLRTLAMLFYIATDKSELLLIEEPEVCVHHGLLKSVIEVIKEYGRSKQILFSTHSEAVVDRLRPEQVLLVQRKEINGTVVTPISKAMSRSGYAALKKYLDSTGSLGEFWRHSGFAK